MLSFVSWMKNLHDSCESTPIALARLPISLAKPILSACQQLSTYLTISAVRGCPDQRSVEVGVEACKNLPLQAVHFTNDSFGRP